MVKHKQRCLHAVVSLYCFFLLLRGEQGEGEELETDVRVLGVLSAGHHWPVGGRLERFHF